jgi:hypothetical protein
MAKIALRALRLGDGRLGRMISVSDAKVKLAGAILFFEQLVPTATSLCAREHALSTCQEGSLSVKKVTFIGLLSPLLDGFQNLMRICFLIGLRAGFSKPSC